MKTYLSLSIKNLALVFFLAMSIFLFIRQFSITYQDTVMYGGTDLRVRIVGSRLMDAGMNPYFTKWRPGMGDYLCDPNDTYDRPVNGVTITPFLLWLQLPLAHFSYGTIRIFWWAFQQLLFLFIVVFCSYFYRHSTIAIVSIIFCAMLLINHQAWILHSERGQLYILYAAWLTILFAFWHFSNKYVGIAIGIWIAIGILMRPSLIIFAVPAFFSIKTVRKRAILITTCGATLLVLLIVSNTWKLWPSYFSALQLYINSVIGGLRFVKETAPLRPAIIENTTYITHYRRDIDFEYLKSLNVYLAERGIWPPRKVYPLVLLFLNGLWLLLTYFITKFRLCAEQMLMLGMLLYVSTEFSEPFRASYNIVVWLPVVLIAVGFVLSGNHNKQLFQSTHSRFPGIIS